MRVAAIILTVGVLTIVFIRRSPWFNDPPHGRPPTRPITNNRSRR